jgi:uncharacterized protein YjbI with pentapeptide repeats
MVALVVRRVLAAAAVTAIALGAAGGASAGNVVTWDPRGEYASGGVLQLDSPFRYTYGVNGKRRTCTLARGAKCVGAQLRGRVKYHGNLRGANLRRADLRFADLRGANLQGADLRSANLKYADLRGANLKGAKFQYARPVHGKKAHGGIYKTPPCAPNCGGADLTYANLGGANFTDANLTYAYLSDANLSDVTWSNITRPDGTVTSTLWKP